MGVGVAIAGLALAAGGAVESHNQQKKALGLQEEQAEVQANLEKSQLQESRRQQVREARVRRAKLLQSAENTGVAGSSGESTAISNLNTRLGANLAFQSGQGKGAEIITGLGVDVAKAQSRGATAQAVGQVGASIFQNQGGFSAFKGTGTKPKTSTPGSVF